MTCTYEMKLKHVHLLIKYLNKYMNYYFEFMPYNNNCAIYSKRLLNIWQVGINGIYLWKPLKIRRILHINNCQIFLFEDDFTLIFYKHINYRKVVLICIITITFSLIKTLFHTIKSEVYFLFKIKAVFTDSIINYGGLPELF